MNEQQTGSNKPLPLVVMIEPQEDKAFATRLAGETEGLWITEVVTTVDQLKALKTSGKRPVCIGFHASRALLPNGRSWNPVPFHEALNDLGWAAVTVLVSAKLDEFTKLAIDRGYVGAVSRDGWVMYLRQYLGGISEDKKINQIESDIQSDESFREKIGNFAERLNSSIVILQEPKKHHEPNLIIQNSSASNNEWDSNDFRRLASLRKQLDVKPRAYLLDWDGRKNLPVECRLYDLGGGYFWYMRDWRFDRAQAIDEVFAHIEKERSLVDRFEGLANYLADRWSISRLRLFEVTVLPDGRGMLGKKQNWISTDQKFSETREIAERFLVVPRLQSGLGWPDDQTGEAEEKKRQPADWWRERFAWKKFTQAMYQKPKDIKDHENWIKRSDINPSALQVEAEHYLYEAVLEPCEVNKVVDWGTCDRRLLVLVPDASLESVEPKSVGSHEIRPLSAILDMDRRSDHLLGDKAKQFNGKEKQRIRLLSEGVIGEELDADMVRSMNHGALSAVRDRVGQWLADARVERERLWEGYISRAIADTVGQGQGMAALSKLCDALLAAWPKLWEDERARLSLSGQLETNTPALPNLSQLFFVTQVGERRVAMPAGSGAAWAHYNAQPTWPMVTPFADLLRDDSNTHQASCWVMQDFQKWWDERPKKNGDFQNAAPHCFAQMGSWVAMRLPDAPGVAPVLLVAHFDGGSQQVWLEVLQLLHRAAHHVRAPFLLAWSEAQERAVWAASVAHEMKNMALLALHDAQHNAGTSPLLVERLQQQLNLAQDFLFNLRPDLSPDAALATQIEVVKVHEVLQNSLSWWQEEMDETEQTDVQWAPEIDFSAVRLRGAQAWHRVLRVLLHNAFQHGEGDVKVGVAFLNQSSNPTQSLLRLTVENRASETAVNLLNQTAHPSLVSVPSAFVRRHIGLKTAMALCQQAGASLEVKAENGRVAVTLDWPVVTSE